MLLLVILLNFINPKDNIEKAYYHYLLGDKSYYEGNYNKAVEEYDIALRFDNNSYEIKSKIAKAYYKLNDLKKSKEILKDVYKNSNEFNISANELYVELLIESSNFDKALEVCNSILNKEAQNRTATLYKAIILIEKGKDDEALNFLNHYSKLNQDDALAYYYIATIYLGKNNTLKAEESLLKSIFIDPAYKPSILSLISIYTSSTSYENTKKLKKLKKLISENGLIQIKLVDLYIDLAQEANSKKEEKMYYEKAKLELKELISIEANNSIYKLKLALLHISLTEYYRAKRILKDLIKNEENNSKYKFYLANVLYMEDRPVEAIKIYTNIDSKSYLYEEAINNACTIMIEKNNLEEAIDIIEKAIVKKSNSIKFHDLYANILHKNKKTKKAIKMLEKSIIIYPENENLLYHLGTLYFETGNNNALKVMEKIIKINPKNPYALNFIAYSLIEDKKDLKKAKKYASQALSYLPNDPYINDTMGWYYYVKKDYKNSIYYLEKSIAILEENGLYEPQITEHLAKTYEASGYLEKSNETYKLLLSDTKLDNNKKNKIKEYLIKNERLPASFK